MRPDRIRRGTFRLAVAGVIEEDQVDIAVAVVVVPGEIHVGIDFLAGVVKGAPGADVVPGAAGVGPVVGHVIVQGNRPDDVENRLEKTVGIIVVIIPGGTGGPVAGITDLVQEVGEGRLRG